MFFLERRKNLHNFLAVFSLWGFCSWAKKHSLLRNIQSFTEESFDTDTYYLDLKRREGGILDYYTQMQNVRLS